MKRLILVMTILLLPAVAPLFQRGYFTMHDDLQAIRQLEMDKCFADRQIPCRWVLDMGYGYGYPLFNYYPPLPYYLGEVVHKLGFQFTDTVKVLGVIGFAASLVAMYLLANQFWGPKGGMLAALFYVYAPYHSTDYYVRGAMNEFWALVWFPLIFWTTYRLIKDGARWIPWVSVSVAALLLTHNPTILILVGPYLLWTFFWLFLFRFSSIRSISYLGFSALWAVGLASFFTLPVLVEAKYVSLWTLTSGYFNYLAHFLDWKQMLLKINWGYGSSVNGPNDTMSFAVGYLHWIIPLAVMILTPFISGLKKHLPVLIFAFCVLIFSLFMMHWKATPIWQAIKPLEFLQFPWRFLTLSVFTGSFLCGAVVLVFAKKWLPLVLASSLALLLLLNANYFHPREWLPNVSDGNKFVGHDWQWEITGSIFDYLPIWAPRPPADPQPQALKFLTGRGVYTVNNYKTNFQQYSVEASSSATLEVQTYYFPGWRVWLDKLEVLIDPTRDPSLGRMQVDVTPGNHDLQVKFLDTPIRFAANAISLIAWSALILYFIPWPKKSRWEM